MSFGSDWAAEFHKLTKNVFFSEVELFTKLGDALANFQQSYPLAIDIIHGAKSFVKFNYQAGPFKMNVSPNTIQCRELADMMFIVGSEKKKEIRLMYLQNKKGQSSTKFKADMLQLYLLHERPLLDSSTLPRCTFGKPDILADSKFPSIGSYGVFYKSSSCIEMSFFPAVHLSLLRLNAQGVHRTVAYSLPGTIQNPSHVIYNSRSYPENQGTQTLAEFGDALINLEIGTPFFEDSDICKSDLFIELIGKSKVFQKLIQSTATFQYNNNNDFPQSVNPSNTPLGCRSIVVIDADALSLD